ncbi:MAG: MBL fold metallo-hydrolase [Kofleriaceae bacterium]|nr:MBL fold metallo-hydrolase [Myxococcales bacterium]MCB9564996.1 MBL fold metallo-hydrolase [Kofleriaceae bacterium]
MRRPRWGVTWLGHAAAALAIDDRRVLVDPLGRARARRAGRVDAILITHSHVDHLNRWTLRGLDRDTHLIVPRGARRVVADLGFARLTEVAPGDHVDVAGLDVVAVPTRHDQGRWRKGSSPLAAGYVVARGGVSLHHAGDVDFSDHGVFDELGRQFTLDATLLPIGGMLPVWYYRMRRAALDRGVHIDPDAALAIAERLGARAMVPVHWGTVNLRLGLPGMPRRRLVKVAAGRGLDKLVRVLGHGETLDGSHVVGDDADQADERDQQADHRAEDAVAERGVGGVGA